MIDQKHCLDASNALRETNDCSVRACAVVTQIDYPSMHAYLRDECGRKQGEGLYSHVYVRALRDLGFTVTELAGPEYISGYVEVDGHWRTDRWGGEFYVRPTSRWTRQKIGPGRDYQSATVRTLARELTSGRYLVTVRRHVLALVDGVVHDWAKDRLKRIEEVYRVEC